jgi:hypothetical protein
MVAMMKWSPTRRMASGFTFSAALDSDVAGIKAPNSPT